MPTCMGSGRMMGGKHGQNPSNFGRSRARWFGIHRFCWIRAPIYCLLMMSEPSNPPYSKWEEVYRFETPGIIQSVIVKEGSGRLTLFFRPSTDPRRIRLSHSIDQGKTWSRPQMTPLPNPLSGISAFITNDNLVVIYNHTEEHQRWPLSASWSRNGGKTWEKVKHLDKFQLEISYPNFILGNNKPSSSSICSVPKPFKVTLGLPQATQVFGNC